MNSTADAVPRLTGSNGLTPTSMLVIMRARAKLNTSPRPIPQQGQLRGVLENRAQDVALFRAKGHTQANLESTLGHGICHGSIDAERCQQQTDPGEAGNEGGAETFRSSSTD